MDSQELQYIDMIHKKGYELFGSSYDRNLMDKRIARWKKDGFTVSGMWKTIHWYFDIEHNSTEESNNGFGIVPYAFYEAKKYYTDLWKLHKGSYTEDAMDKMIDAATDEVSVPPMKPPKQNYLKGFTLS